MTDLNHVVLIGRLTQDLGSDERSFGYVGNGQARANVSIAVSSLPPPCPYGRSVEGQCITQARPRFEQRNGASDPP